MGNYATPAAAYWAFFERFNAQDADGWAGAMSYPHVRVSAPPPRGDGLPRTSSGLYQNAADYARMATSAGWQRFEASGWVRTQGITPRVVHASPDEVHLAGGWTRHRADDSAIISNRVLYVMTRTDGGWGIQARFGVDSWSRDQDYRAQAVAAVNAAEALGALRNAGDFETFAERISYPLTIVGVGEVARIETPEDFLSQRAGLSIRAVPGSARAVNAGRHGVNVAARRRTDDAERDEILLMIERSGEWKLAAVSAIP